MSSPPDASNSKFVTLDAPKLTEDIVDQLRSSLAAEVQKVLKEEGREDAGRNTMIGSLARVSIRQKEGIALWKTMTLRIGVLLLVALIANFGLVIWATDLQKETELVDGSYLVGHNGEPDIVKTAPAQTYLSLRHAAVMDMHHLADIDEVGFMFSAAQEKVIAKVATVSKKEVNGFPLTTFVLVDGNRLVVDPHRFALIPGGGGFESGVMDRVYMGHPPSDLAEHYGVNQSEVDRVIQKYMLCQGLPGASDSNFDARCNTLFVNDPALDVAALDAKLADTRKLRELSCSSNNGDDEDEEDSNDDDDGDDPEQDASDPDCESASNEAECNAVAGNDDVQCEWDEEEGCWSGDDHMERRLGVQEAESSAPARQLWGRRRRRRRRCAIERRRCDRCDIRRRRNFWSALTCSTFALHWTVTAYGCCSMNVDFLIKASADSTKCQEATSRRPDGSSSAGTCAVGGSCCLNGDESVSDVCCLNHDLCLAGCNLDDCECKGLCDNALVTCPGQVNCGVDCSCLSAGLAIATAMDGCPNGCKYDDEAESRRRGHCQNWLPR